MKLRNALAAYIALILALVICSSNAIRQKDPVIPNSEEQGSHITRLSDNIQTNLAANQTRSTTSNIVPPMLINRGSKSSEMDWGKIKETLIAYQDTILFNC